jgi:hypothetical protein
MVATKRGTNADYYHFFKTCFQTTFLMVNGHRLLGES